MKNFADFLRILLFGIAIAWIAGVRIHPSALGDYTAGIPKIVKEPYRLELANGKTLTGEVVKKDETGIIFKSEGAAVNFSRSEIANLVPLKGKAAAIKSAPSSKRPLITLSTYDSPLARFFSMPKESRSQSSLSERLFPTPDVLSPPVSAYTYIKSFLQRAFPSKK